MNVGSIRITPKVALQGLALARVGLGVVALVAPKLPATPWVGGAESKKASVRVLGRALGIRDVSLGAAVLLASSDTELQRSSALGALSDLGDSLATVLDFHQLPKWGRLMVLASAGGAAILGAVGVVLMQREQALSS